MNKSVQHNLEEDMERDHIRTGLSIHGGALLQEGSCSTSTSMGMKLDDCTTVKVIALTIRWELVDQGLIRQRIQTSILLIYDDQEREDVACSASNLLEVKA
jgi:hypothetical protein